MNEELIKLYEEHWASYCEHLLHHEDTAFPFLLNATDKYMHASKRIMFCGQEMQGWNCEQYNCRNKATVKSVIDRYKIFRHNGYRKSPFWNFQKQIKTSNPPIGFISNNIVKIGKQVKPGCNNEVFEKTIKYFPVFRSEVEILKPDILISLTGPHFDWRIEKVLGKFKKTAICTNGLLLDKFEFDDTSLPVAIRLNHLGYFIRKKYYALATEVNKFIKERLHNII